LVHNLGWPFETELALSRLVFSVIMERHPTLKVVSHHLWGGIPFFLSRTIETCDPPVQQEFIGKVLPKSLFDYFSLFYYDTAVGGSAPAIRCAYEVFGADKLVFATDAPFGSGRGKNRLTNYPTVVRSLGLFEDENKKIFRKTREKFSTCKESPPLIGGEGLGFKRSPPRSPRCEGPSLLS
jgi:aminocarboxymuconate-semialdehyde decarboxylase